MSLSEHGSAYAFSLRVARVINIHIYATSQNIIWELSAKEMHKQKQRGSLELPEYKKGAEYISVYICKEMLWVLCEKVKHHDTALHIHTCWRQTVPGHTVFHLEVPSFAINLHNCSRVNFQACNSLENPQGLSTGWGKPILYNGSASPASPHWFFLFLYEVPTPFWGRLSGETRFFLPFL